MKYPADAIERETIPAGNHPAILIGIVELGIQSGGKFADRAETLFTWEFPDQRYSYRAKGITVQATRQHSQRYTANMSARANMRKMIEGWHGVFPNNQAAADFDISQLLDRPCLVQIANKASADGAKVYVDVVSVGPLPKSMEDKPPVRTRDLMFYEIEKPDADLFAALPQWVRGLILNRVKTQAPKAQTAVAQTVAAGAVDFDDDVPF